MTEITIRPLEAADVEGVQAVALAAWQYTYRDIFDPAFIEAFVARNYAPDRLARTLPRMAAGQAHFDVAEEAGQIVGFCHIELTPDGPQLFRIYVQPRTIGHGLGHRFLERGESFVRARNFDRYGCFVHSRNEIGKRFYLRRGFQHLAERDQDDEWYMQKVLLPFDQDVQAPAAREGS